MSTDDIDINLSGIDIDLQDGAIATAGVQAMHAGNGDVDISITGTTTNMMTTPSTIDTTGANTHGILGVLVGEGTLTFSLEDTEIRTQGTGSIGLQARHKGNGHLKVDLRNGVVIDTQGGGSAIGVRMVQENAAADQVNDVTFLGEGISVTTAGSRGYGLFATREGGPGNILMAVRDSTVMTQGNTGVGVYGEHSGTGDTTITLVCTDSPAVPCEITTRGTRGHGVHSRHHASSSGDARIKIQGNYDIRTGSTATNNAYGIYGLHQGTGNIDIDLQGSAITTTGAAAHGIHGWKFTGSRGNVDIDVQGGSITTDGTAAHGAYGAHQGTGNIEINLQDGAITTAGATSYGIYGLHTRSGNIHLATQGGNGVTTQGSNAHGVVALHLGTATSGRTIDITVGSPTGLGGFVRASGTGARGVHVGGLSNGAPIRVAARGADGFLQQTVRVNRSITSAAEGVYLAGGGRVVIGPSGHIDSGSDIAILATGTVPEDTSDMNNVIPAIPPRLRVDLNPSGQRMTGDRGWLAQALGGGWILNDGGETTIAVHHVVLHEGATGVVPGAVARNGAWNVTMRPDGVTVTDRSTDPFTTSVRTANVIADRDFDANDFTEEAGMCPAGQVGDYPDCMNPPPPPQCPEGQTGTPPNCVTPPPRQCPAGYGGTYPNCTMPQPEPEPMPDPEPAPDPGTTEPDADPDPDSSEPSGPMIIEDYAPRAALYEALPEFLLGLRTQTDSAAHRLSAALPLWLEVSGHSGEHDPQDSTVGTGYDTGHRVAALGGTLVHNEHWNVQASVHRVSGSAEVSSAVKGGDIEAEGRGISLQARWSPGGGPYASGRIAWTDYALDLDSDDAAVGRLVSSVGAERLALQLEAGHRLPWGTRSFLTPQVGVSHTQVDIDGFTDATGARAAFRDTERSSARLGVRADTTTTGVALYGSVHLAHHLETGTTADVSGERLRARTPDHDLHLALGAQWQTGPWVLEAAISAREAGSGNSMYSGTFHIGMPF